MKKLSRFLRVLLTVFVLLCSTKIYSQCVTDIPPLPTYQGAYDASNGYILPASGTVRVLMIFVEVVYVGGNDPNPNNTNYWDVHELPDWKDDLFDAIPPAGVAQGSVTRYYQMASSENLTVLGDYLIAPTNNGIFQILDSNIPTDPTNLYQPVWGIVNSLQGTNLVTNQGFSITDFDAWTNTGTGVPKINSPNNPYQYDCVMMIFRNLAGYTGNGRTYFANSDPLVGYGTESRIQIGSFDGIPTAVARHEFAHLLYGGNSFHAGYEWGGTDYWIPLQSGWSNLSLSTGSLMSWNGWDRKRLDWIAPGNSFNPAARDASNTNEVNGDIDPLNSAQAGIYYLRDFVTTGDALRIKIPYTDDPATEYPEYIWIENHATISINNCEFDQWNNYGYGCNAPAIPGLYMYMQIDRDANSSNNWTDVYSGYAQYLRPITADGFFDKEFTTSTMSNACTGGNNFAFTKILPNPLTGGGDQEAYEIDFNPQNQVLDHVDQKDNWIENINGTFYPGLYYAGDARNVFTISGNKKIGMGTNPSSASMMNMVGYDWPPTPGAKNLRRIYLNGISVEILNQYPNGDCQVQVRFDDVNIDQDVRWCANGIELNPIPTTSGISLNLKSGHTIHLDQGSTATRMDNPIPYNGTDIFDSATFFYCRANSWVNLESNSTILVDNGSSLFLQYQSKIVLQPNAQIIVRNNSKLILESGSLLQLEQGAKVIIEDGSTLEYYPNAEIQLNGVYSSLEIADCST